jgi:hypothetical protein
MEQWSCIDFGCIDYRCRSGSAHTRDSGALVVHGLQMQWSQEYTEKQWSKLLFQTREQCSGRRLEMQEWLCIHLLISPLADITTC